MRQMYLSGCTAIPDKAPDMRPWIGSIPVYAWHYISAGSPLFQSDLFPDKHPGEACLAAIQAGLAQVHTPLIPAPSPTRVWPEYDLGQTCTGSAAAGLSGSFLSRLGPSYLTSILRRPG